MYDFSDCFDLLKEESKDQRKIVEDTQVTPPTDCQHCRKALDLKAFIHQGLALCVSCGEDLLVALWEWDQNTDSYITECLSK